MGRKPKEFNKEEVRRLYLTEHNTPAEISETIGVSLPIIMTFLKKENIYYDGRKERGKIQNERLFRVKDDEELAVQKQEIDGQIISTEIIDEVQEDSKYFNPKEEKITDFIASNNGKRPECPKCKTNEHVFYYQFNGSNQITTGFHCMNEGCDTYFGLENKKI